MSIKVFIHDLVGKRRDNTPYPVWAPALQDGSTFDEECKSFATENLRSLLGRGIGGEQSAEHLIHSMFSHIVCTDPTPFALDKFTDVEQIVGQGLLGLLEMLLPYDPA